MSLQRGAGPVGEEVGRGVGGGVGSRTLPSPSAVQEKQVASGDEGGVLGAGGSESSVLTFPLHPQNVRGLLMRWRRVKHSPAPEG